MYEGCRVGDLFRLVDGISLIWVECVYEIWNGWLWRGNFWFFLWRGL